MSYYLVFRNRSLAGFVAGQAEEPLEGDPPEMQQVVVGLVGVLVIAYALPSLVTNLDLMLTLSMRDRELVRFTIAEAVQVLIGLVLLLRPDLVLRLWVSREPEAAKLGRAGR